MYMRLQVSSTTGLTGPAPPQSYFPTYPTLCQPADRPAPRKIAIPLGFSYEINKFCSWAGTARLIRKITQEFDFRFQQNAELSLHGCLGQSDKRVVIGGAAVCAGLLVGSTSVRVDEEVGVDS